MKFKFVQPKKLGNNCLRRTVAGVIGLFCIGSLSASPIINNFSSTAGLDIYGASLTFDNHGGAGPLDIIGKSPGAFGQMIFYWSQPLSLNLTDEQFIFAVNGAGSIGSTPATLDTIYFGISSGGGFSVKPIPLANGSWSLNIYEQVSQRFYSGGALPAGLTYTTQFYIRPDNSAPVTSGVVYQLGSLSAVPEPSAILLVGLGFAILCWKIRGKKVRA